MAQLVKNPPSMREARVRSLGWEDPLEEKTATYSSIPAWEIPWTEDPCGIHSIRLQKSGGSILAWEISWTEESGGLQSMGLQNSDLYVFLTILWW